MCPFVRCQLCVWNNGCVHLLRVSCVFGTMDVSICYVSAVCLGQWMCPFVTCQLCVWDNGCVYLLGVSCVSGTMDVSIC